MTEATDKGNSATGALQSAGAQLKEARESRNLTIQQVAQALHLDPWILEALEQNRFKDVGAPVFVKGHLRKYAAEVGLDGQQLMEAYYRADDAPETPGLVTDTFTRPGREEHGHWPIIAVSALIVLMIIVVTFLWLRGGGIPSIFESDGRSESADLAPASEASAMPALDNDDGVVGDNVMRIAEPAAGQESEGLMNVTVNNEESLEELTPAEAEDKPQTAAAVVDPGSVATQTEPGDGQLRVSITLQNDSWVEIYDANNRRLFFDLARSGSTKNVTGKPPLQVLLGNAEDARVRVDGTVWPIPAAARRGKTARFTIR